jgi:hypothetical protein
MWAAALFREYIYSLLSDFQSISDSKIYCSSAIKAI